MSLYKETLMRHFRNPQFKVENPHFNIKEDGINPSCGDNLTLFYNSQSNCVKEISFTGNGCAISMASSDILCSIITKTANPLNLIESFISMLDGKDITFDQDFKELEVFKEMQNYPARKSCALLPWVTLERSLRTH